MHNPFSSTALLKSLPGFESHFVQVNGTRLHYIEGGHGQALILLPGYPETWWSCHQIMPLLASEFRLFVVEMRGMGDSDKPADGYDKRNMAKDLYELTRLLNLEKVFIAGQDIGAHVAYSFAANFPGATEKVILIDTPHPEEGMYLLPMLPIPGAKHIYPWWLAFNQIKELPEEIMEGRMNIVIDWMFDQLLVNLQGVTGFDRSVYAFFYNSKDAIRASNGWYQAFNKDIADFKAYRKIELPLLAIGGSGYEILENGIKENATAVKLVKIDDCGHFLLSEKPQECAAHMISFLNAP